MCRSTPTIPTSGRAPSFVRRMSRRSSAMTLSSRPVRAHRARGLPNLGMMRGSSSPPAPQVSPRVSRSPTAPPPGSSTPSRGCSSRPSRIGLGDRVMAGLSVAFDASCEEMWLAWRHGACLVPAPRSLVRSGMDSVRGLWRTRSLSSPRCQRWWLLWPPDALDKVRLLILGGEACPPEIGHVWRRPSARSGTPTDHRDDCGGVRGAAGREPPVRIGPPSTAGTRRGRRVADDVAPGRPGSWHRRDRAGAALDPARAFGAYPSQSLAGSGHATRRPGPQRRGGLVFGGGLTTR